MNHGLTNVRGSSVQTPFPIDRWLSERPEEAPWNNLGGVFGSDQGTASDGNNVKKNTWSNVAVDGMSKASGSRYKLHHGSNNNRK